MGAPHDLSAERVSYERDALDETSLAATWPQQFERWLIDARRDPPIEPSAMVLSTAGADVAPGSRTVLLKAWDETGFVFYTNLHSAKGRQLRDNPAASLLFPWLWLERQVIVTGRAQPVPAAQADAYFDSRPLGSRISAIVSPQSEIIASRDTVSDPWRHLERAVERGAALVRPEHWGGLRIVPSAVEFWQGRPDRLHDRLRFRRDSAGGWFSERLAP
ncbi:MAG TPA: pyridoxamine 5'-phosphate oxidase [Solirubrobacteraceae bacterium]|nr:pyridoxamine 5'-phosphate oxidase [Solirubrobacteraceae bacterium]